MQEIEEICFIIMCSIIYLIRPAGNKIFNEIQISETKCTEI